MTDYDLGRAHGTVRIDADSTGLTRAQAAIAATGTEARRLEGALGDVERQFGRNSDQYRRASAEVDAHNAAVRALNQDYARLGDSMEDARRRQQQFAQGTDEHTRALQDEERAIRSIEQSQRRMSNSLDNSIRGFRDFDRAKDNTRNNIKGLSADIDGASRSMAALANMMSKTLVTAFRAVATAAGAGIAGGGLGLLGAGGAQALTVGLTAAVGVIIQLSGAIALLPAMIGGTVVALAALKIGLSGVSDALSNMDDFEKFNEALSEMAPAAQQAMLKIQQFRDVFRGAKQVIQQGLFEPLVDSIEPLVRSLLPLLTHGLASVANIIGQAGAEFASWITSTESLSGLANFIENVVNGLRSMLPAIKPIGDALLTLSVVGSSFFKQIGENIVEIANAFNSWVQGAAATGQLQNWIQGAIDGFSSLWAAVRDFGAAIGNVFNIANSINGSGGFLATFAQWMAQFREWTSSVEGQNALTTFFTAVQNAADQLWPILKQVGTTLIETVIPTLVNLGTAISPAILGFFEKFDGALKNLAPNIIAAAPALSKFLGILGDLIVAVTDNLGDKVPNVMDAFAGSAEILVEPINLLSQAIGWLLDHLSPEVVTIIGGLVLAFQALSVIIPIVSSVMAAWGTITAIATAPVTLIVLAVLALIAVGVLLYKNWDTVSGWMQTLWNKMKEFGNYISTSFVNAWNSLATSVSTAWNNVVDAIQNGYNSVIAWFDNLGTGISNSVSEMANDAWNWGAKIVERFIDGIKSMFQPLSDAWDWLTGNAIDDKNPKSPPKKGPLSGKGDPLLAGQNITGRLAEGITLGAPGVSAAYDSALPSGGSESGGSGGASFTSAGVAGRSGEAGKSGFEQWVASLTGELQQWSNIAKGAFDLFRSIGNIFIQSTKIVASLWNRGDNPLTREGGIAGPPKIQNQVEGWGGVPAVPKPGKAPLPELVPQGGAPAAGSVDDINIPAGGANPNQAPSPLAPDGTKRVPGEPSRPGVTPGAKPPPAAAPSDVTKTGNIDVAGVKYTGQDAELAKELKSHGFTDSQIVGLVALNGVETGNWSHPESIMGFTDNQTGPGIQAHTAGFKEMWDRRQRTGAVVNSGHPESGMDANGQVVDPQKYAAWLLKLEGYSATTDWQGNKYPEGMFVSDDKYAKSVSDAYNNLPTTSPTAPPAAGGNTTTPSIFSGVGTEGNNDKYVNPDGSPRYYGPMDGSAPESGLPSDVVRMDVLPKSSDSQGPNAQRIRRGEAPIPDGLSAGNIPYGLPTGTDTGGYGSGNADTFPPWLIALGQAYGVTPSTYEGHQESDRGETGYEANPQHLNRGVDWVGSRADLERFAKALVEFGGTEGKDGALEQVIYQAGPGGTRYGLGGAGNVNPDYYDADTYGGHGGREDNIHVHTRFNRSINVGPGTSTQAQNVGNIGNLPASPAQPTGGDAWRTQQVDENWLSILKGQGYTDLQARWMLTHPQGTPMPPDIDVSTVGVGNQTPPPPGPAPVPTKGNEGKPTPAFVPGMKYRIQQPDGTTMIFDTPQPGSTPYNPLAGTAPSADVLNAPTTPADVGQQWEQRQPGITDGRPVGDTPLIPPRTAGTAATAGLDNGVNIPGITGVPKDNSKSDNRSPIDKMSDSLSSAGSIAGDAFEVFNNFIKSIDAAAGLTATFVRGFENTEDIMRSIDQFQQFITTAASVAKLVGSVANLVGQAGKGDPTGGTSAGAGAVAAVAGVVQSALEATNAAIDVGQEVYRIVTKYGAIFAGNILGGPETGPLSGNVRMLLNTRNGEIYSYAQENPEMKNTKTLPSWFQNAYGGTRPELNQDLPATVNIYAGPGQTPRDMMNESMWLVSSGMPSVSSVAGQD